MRAEGSGEPVFHSLDACPSITVLTATAKGGGARKCGKSGQNIASGSWERSVANLATCGAADECKPRSCSAHQATAWINA